MVILKYLSAVRNFWVAESERLFFCL